jgi:hypothetical protein
LVFYGFLAMILARETKKQNNKYKYYIVTVILVTLIALSRLYLGAHWLSDIIGSILLGLFILFIATICYRRHNSHFSAQKTTVLAISIFTTVWLCYSTIEFKQFIKDYTIIWPKQNVTFSQAAAMAPLYRIDRLGHATEALNIEWIGNIEEIENSLLKQGWQNHIGRLDLRSIIKKFFGSSAVYHHPIFPQLYHNAPPVLVLTNTIFENSIIVLYLWNSDITVGPQKLPLLVGTIKYYHHNPYNFSLAYFKRNYLFMGATEVFSDYLHNFKVAQIKYSNEQQPIEMNKLHWDGKLLIIYE